MFEIFQHFWLGWWNSNYIADYTRVAAAVRCGDKMSVRPLGLSAVMCGRTGGTRVQWGHCTHPHLYWPIYSKTCSIKRLWHFCCHLSCLVTLCISCRGSRNLTEACLQVQVNKSRPFDHWTLCEQLVAVPVPFLSNCSMSNSVKKWIVTVILMGFMYY